MKIGDPTPARNTNILEERDKINHQSSTIPNPPPPPPTEMK